MKNKNQTPVSAKAGQENCPLCEVSPETIEKLKNQSKEQQNQKSDLSWPALPASRGERGKPKPEKKTFWQKLFKNERNSK